MAATRSNVRTALVLGSAYFSNFGGLAASAPFLALVLHDAGVSDAATAEWLALFLFARVVATPSWTVLADRRSIPGVLRLVTIGAIASFAPLFLPLPAAIVIACVATFSLFRAPFGALLDALTLAEQEAGGALFGRLRAWGTAGYTLGALATGALIARMGTRGVIASTVGFLAFATIASFAAHADHFTPPRATTTATRAPLLAFLKRPRVIALMAIAMLHQVGLAPYDSLFPAYYTSIAGPMAASAAVALGAGSEFVFLLLGASLPKRWGPARLIRLACVGSAVRWAIVGFTRDPVVLLAAQSLHALTFGAYYVSSVAIVDEESASSSRATAQGTVGAWSYGVSAALALSLSGIIQRYYDLAVVFRIGAIASAIAATIPLKNRVVASDPGNR